LHFVAGDGLRLRARPAAPGREFLRGISVAAHEVPECPGRNALAQNYLMPHSEATVLPVCLQVPYVMVRGNSDFLYKPLQNLGNGTWGCVPLSCDS